MEITCIVCPVGCRIQATENGGDITVTGHQCKRGEDYARREFTAPARDFATTVALTDAGSLRRLPVRASSPVPKEKVIDCVRALRGVTVAAPVQIGQVIAENIAGTGVNVIATRSIHNSQCIIQ
ncbi:MAG: DUF1667 domain-containing protein [Oscillospiraceae bacterium]|nr:DUF1667 domain-containing protein [Oscillospiraceae bacterium]